MHEKRHGAVDTWPETVQAQKDNPMIGWEKLGWMEIMEDRIRIQAQKIPRRKNDKGFKG
jgi:hypothetical protein